MNLKTSTRLWLTALAIALLSLLAAGCSRAFAFGDDSPIIITDGSLKLQAPVGWQNFAASGPRTKIHPDPSRTVTRVEVKLPGKDTTVTVGAARVEVSIRYASTDIVVSSVADGKNLKIESTWTSFRAGATADLLEHNDQGSKISRVIVRRNGTTIVDERPNGGTQVIVHYEN